MYKIWHYIILMLLLVIQMHGQTTISGGIYSNTTWTKAGNPYFITSDVVVFEDVTLNIKPGVTIYISPDVQFDVRGKLNVQGSKEEPVIIKGDTLGHRKNFWKGFRFIGNTGPLGIGDQANIEYCRISDASVLFNLDIAYHGPYRFTNCEFTHNAYVNLDGGYGGTYFSKCTLKYNYTCFENFDFDGSVKDCIVDSNSIGFYFFSDSVINCIITNNTMYGIHDAVYIDNCDIGFNNVGVRKNFNGEAYFQNNRIHDNEVGLQVMTYFSGFPISNNTFCNNRKYNIESEIFNNAWFGNNCWCGLTEAEIRNSIYDGYKDISKGIVSFTPIRDTCYLPNIALKDSSISLLLYPNPLPTNEILYINNFIDSADVQVRVFDLYGQAMKSNVSWENNKLRIELGNLAKGFYILNIFEERIVKYTSFKFLVN